jgi:hypothetical protein
VHVFFFFKLNKCAYTIKSWYHRQYIYTRHKGEKEGKNAPVKEGRVVVLRVKRAAVPLREAVKAVQRLRRALGHLGQHGRERHGAGELFMCMYVW